MKILILCSDNSCLSQMAQGWLQSFDRTLIVHSAGISPAIEVHPLAVQTLASSGIDISHHKPEAVEEYIGEFYQFNLSSCIRQQNSLTAQFVSFSLSNLANIFYPPPIFTIINLCLL